MATSTTFSASFLLSLLPPDTKILKHRIYFRVKKLTLTTNMIYNHENLQMNHPLLKGLTSLYLMHLWTESAPSYYHRNCFCRRPHYFFLDLSNAFKNTILSNPTERVYLSLPYIYLYWYRRKWPKHPLA